jgi:protease IV
MTKHTVRVRTMILWLFLGGIVLMMAFGLSSYFAVFNIIRTVEGESETFVESGDLAILKVEGVIFDSEDIMKSIRELEDKDEIKAVVVRINSPGGAVAPSQEIFDAVKRLRESKSVICSLGDVAASGGYYIAAACDRIVSNPGTLTGSIGVIMHFVNLKDLYTWAKVEPFIIKAGRYKDMGAENRPMTEEEKKLLQEMIDQVHAQFKTAVESGRKLSKEVVDQYADGRVFSGEQALALGFVDALGGEVEAIALAAKLAGIKGEPNVIRENPHRRQFGDFFETKKESSVVKEVLGAFAPALAVKLMPGVPYYLPAHLFSAGR